MKSFLNNKENPDLVHVETQIKEAIQKSKNQPGDPWMNAIKANVQLSIKNLSQNPVLKKWIESDQLQIQGGYYELESGKIHLF